eukprot:TRINITY_DN2039_c0_g1_i3.p1 TRINITY_DN2039_c0_g1~~TRINITY_DN2039_c0_g1_i3.p1  ORF type:complete len:912 (+),score=215.56 TRINITY_DN2039_c0_g1_i3:157-2892(+)
MSQNGHGKEAATGAGLLDFHKAHHEAESKRHDAEEKKKAAKRLGGGFGGSSPDDTDLRGFIQAQLRSLIADIRRELRTVSDNSERMFLDLQHSLRMHGGGQGGIQGIGFGSSIVPLSGSHLRPSETNATKPTGFFNGGADSNIDDFWGPVGKSTSQVTPFSLNDDSQTKRPNGSTNSRRTLARRRQSMADGPPMGGMPPQSCVQQKQAKEELEKDERRAEASKNGQEKSPVSRLASRRTAKPRKKELLNGGLSNYACNKKKKEDMMRMEMPNVPPFPDTDESDTETLQKAANGDGDFAATPPVLQVPFPQGEPVLIEADTATLQNKKHNNLMLSPNDSGSENERVRPMSEVGSDSEAVPEEEEEDDCQGVAETIRKSRPKSIFNELPPAQEDNALALSARKTRKTPKDEQSGGVMGRLSITRELAKSKKGLEDEKQFCQMSLEEMMNSPKFDNLVGGIIIFNAITIGAQTDYNARSLSLDVPLGFQLLEYGFAFWFTLELTMRICVHKCMFFSIRREGWLWNWFDFFVVAAQLVELFVELLATSANLDAGNLRLLRVLRILRLVRILRVVRVLHLISELRTIVSSIVGSFRSLAWTCVLLLLMIYIVAVYFTQSITDHLVEREADMALSDHEQTLADLFNSIGRAILSLFQAMSGGLDWDTIAGPMFMEISSMNGFLFVCYIAFALLALMNVVTGVFVQTALQSARNEEDSFMTDQIVSIFKSSRDDSDSVLTLSEDEIAQSIEDPGLAKEWKSIGVAREDARYLFRLLDVEGNGEVPFAEFLGGALRLNGAAKAIDLLTVMQENRKTALWQHRAMGEIKDSIDILIEYLHGPIEGEELNRLPDGRGMCTALHDNVYDLRQAGFSSNNTLRHLRSSLEEIDARIRHLESYLKLEAIDNLLQDQPSQATQLV